MDVGDWIQIAALAILIGVLVVSILQTRGLRKSFDIANVLARHEMYFRTYENAQRIGDPAFLKMVEAYPEDWAKPQTWSTYSEKEKLLSLWFLSLYEYFAHELELRELGLIDAEEWDGTVEWIKDLLLDSVFGDVCEHHARNYPKLNREIGRIRTTIRVETQVNGSDQHAT